MARALAARPSLIVLDEPCVCARRFDSGAGHQPAQRATRTVRAYLSVHRPRPVRRSPHQPPGSRNVPGQGGRGRNSGRVVQQPPAPVHPSAPLSGPNPRPAPRTRTSTHRPAGGHTQPGKPAERMRISHSMPHRRRRLFRLTSPNFARSRPVTLSHASRPRATAVTGKTCPAVRRHDISTRRLLSNHHSGLRTVIYPFRRSGLRAGIQGGDSTLDNVSNLAAVPPHEWFLKGLIRNPK